MVIKVGINGFGRIGRVIFRTCHQNPDLEVAAINDPAIDVEYICYLIKFDSTHGKFRGKITHTQNEITVDDAKIKIFHDKLPSNVPWQSADVHYVVEASGIFTSLQKASGHLEGGSVKRVIVTAPSADVPMVILGVNDGDLNTDTRVLSSASSTLYCLAPIIKILNDHFGVNEGFLTSIHAMTPSLKPLDGLCLRGKHWRDHRSIHQNIIPAATGACKALGKVIPQVKDRLVGLAFRVPIVNVSVLDLTLRLNKETSIEEIVKAVDAYGKSTLLNIVKISNEDAVSSDFVGDQHSCILDVGSSLQLKKNFFKLVCWYENEFSYACRVVDLIFFSEKQFLLPDPKNKMTFVRTRLCKKYVQKHDDEIKDDQIKNFDGQSINTPQISTSNSQIRSRLRSPIRTMIIRKPLSANLSVNSQESSKSDAVFRIWNDEEIKILKSANYHSSDEITPQSQVNNSKAQQRLENVKKEFSKMVSITERLLRKCSRIREFGIPEKVLEEKLEAKRIDGTDIRKPLEDAAELSPVIHKNNLLSNVSGDYISNIEVRNSKNNFSTENFSNDSNRNSSMYDISTKSESSNTLNPGTSCNSANLARNSNDVIEARSMKENTVVEVFQDQVVKTINNLIDGLTHSMDVKVDDNYQNNDEDAKPEKVTCLNESIQNKGDSGFVSPVKNKIRPAGRSNDENTSPKLIVEGKSSDVNRVEIIGNNAFEKNATSDINSPETAKDHSHNENCPAEAEKPLNTDCLSAISVENQNKMPAEILNSLNKFFEPIIIMADNSKCASSTLTASANSETGRKMDIYDKLDSVSGSDSENSFQIHERKSQVINISDLTSSIEDLVRLDKICRIIEISDELSDKLFSALGSADNAAIQKTKWSFKDLCQRIKLDEFCNSLFSGQSCHNEQKK